MKEISETGYWNAETAHIHHVHSFELSKWIADFLSEQKDVILYDFGCGLGNYLFDLSLRGFVYLVGIEGDIPKKAVFGNILQMDLTNPINLSEQGNVISLEVGEHIPKEYMNAYLDNITNACNKYLIMSWAIPGQDGFGHVNCLDNKKIIEEIEKRRFKFLNFETESARSVIGDNTPWFKNTILIFEKC